MNPRIVTLFLTPCLLLAQSAALFGHTHHGGKPSEHQLRPHVHTQQVFSIRDHGHPHVGSSHHHGHHHGHHQVDSFQSPGESNLSWPDADHDSDAVYLPGPHATCTMSFGGMNSVSPSRELNVASFLILPSDPSGLQLSRLTKEGPIRAPNCPLYVRQCALLI